jgi:hypothetical protein
VSANRRSLSFLNVKWPDKISNEELWRRTKQIPIQQQIIKEKIRVRLTMHFVNQKVQQKDTHIEWNTQGARKRGKPRLTWKRTEWNCRKVEKAAKGAKELALDRTKWKSIMNVVCSTLEQMEKTANATDSRFSEKCAVLDHLRCRFDHSAVIEGAAESVVRCPQLEQIRAAANFSLPHAALQHFITALPEL